MTTPTSPGGPTWARRGYRVTNDLDLIRDVLRLAIDPGYVLIGPAERVYRRDPDHSPSQSTGRGTEWVVAVPGFEGDVVAQLLDSGHLRRGGRRTVALAEQYGPATSVLVTKAARSMLTRWTALVPLGRGSQR